jgi:hypothetical protein
MSTRIGEPEVDEAGETSAGVSPMNKHLGEAIRNRRPRRRPGHIAASRLLPCRARLSQGPEGDRVPATPSPEMATEAEHVRPLTQAKARQFLATAKVPAGRHYSSDMLTHVELVYVSDTKAAIQTGRDCLCALG